MTVPLLSNVHWLQIELVLPSTRATTAGLLLLIIACGIKKE